VVNPNSELRSLTSTFQKSDVAITDWIERLELSVGGKCAIEEMLFLISGSIKLGDGFIASV